MFESSQILNLISALATHLLSALSNSKYVDILNVGPPLFEPNVRCTAHGLGVVNRRGRSKTRFLAFVALV